MVFVFTSDDHLITDTSALGIEPNADGVEDLS